MTDTRSLPAARRGTAPAPPTRQAPTAYDPMPSVSRLLTELRQEDFWARYAHIRGDAEHFPADYFATRRRNVLLLRAVIADLFALADPADARAAAEAGRAANAVRRGDWILTCSGPEARAWLRGQFREWETSQNPHPPNCPGGCSGSGEVRQVVTWHDSSDEPLRQETVWCDRGELDDPHAANCICHGTGFTYARGERHLCRVYSPQPYVDPPASPDLAVRQLVAYLAAVSGGQAG